MVVGLLSFVIIKLLPSAFQYVATILFFCSFSGLLYIYFLPEFKSKLIVLLIFLAFLILNAISIGMFTIVAYMSITIFSFFFIGRKTWLLKKVLILLTAVFIIIVLQNTKVTYRSYVWNKNYGGNNTLLFTTLFIDNLQKGDLLIEKRAFFPIYTRTNQGFYISLVMKRIPSLQPFDNGKVLTNTILSSLVPRFLWPDKPEAGGKFNMNFYAGRKLRGYSANVGPMGEAYGSFGIKGGIIFMFMLGLFIRWTYGRLLALTSSIPLIIFWLPVLYFQVTYSAETDTLQILNSLVKTAFFMWILYKFFPRWYGVNRQTTSVKSDKKVLSNQFV
jgi:hypothetical protein